METYIVRIYERRTRKDREMMGVVELVGRDEKRVFSGPDELWGIIDPAEAVRSAPVKGRRKKRKQDK